MDSFSGLRTAVYARFSSDNQKDTSIEDQVKDARAFLARYDGSVSDDFVLSDRAVSGQSLAREGFERLLQLVGTRAVDLVVTESGSRLSRDLGDADRLWKLCEFHGVRLICIVEGVDSARDGARMQFQINAVMSDQYLVKLGKETFRGLRGAAERGTCTGGLPYGYASEPIWNGNREPDGYKIIVHPEQAAVVGRIFEMYEKGYSLLLIAQKLNVAVVPPPRANSKKRRSQFWRKTTLREMLGNPAYVGTWSFGKKQWRKDPISRRRRYTKRPTTDVLTADRPHLAIISPELWERVQVRKKAVHDNYKGKADGAPGRRTAHPFAGLLHCGLCGHRMVDGGGSSARYYKCSGASSGGICLNKTPVREDVLIDAAIKEFRRVLLETDLRDQLHEKVEERLRTFKSETANEQKRLERELARADSEVERFVSFIRTTDTTVNPTSFEVIRASLEEAARKQRELKTRLEHLRAATPNEPRVPTVDEIVALVLDIEARIKQDPTSARETLRKHLVNGMISLTPGADGTYDAVSNLILGRLLRPTRKPRSGGPGGASGVSHGIVGNDGCAGRI